MRFYYSMTPLPAQRSRTDRAFERVYRRHVGDVYRYALAVMRNQADAEDVTQTTFLDAYRAYVEKGSRPEKPQNWLMSIAHDVCRRRLCQSARRPTEILSGDDFRRPLREQIQGSFSCGEAEFAISRRLDGRLSRHQRAHLRAHLRECADCASFARRQRAQRGALKTLALVPVPTSVTSLVGGGEARLATGRAVKVATALTAALVIGGVGYEGVRHAPRDKPALGAASSPKAVVARRGPHETRYAGDAGVAARHVKVAHAPHPPRSARAHVSTQQEAQGQRQLPGPFDTNPPSGRS